VGIVALPHRLLSPLAALHAVDAPQPTAMFVQSEKVVEEHGGRIGDIAVYGQESNSTTRRLAMMNLAIRGIEGELGSEHADTFRRDLHKDLKADDVLANPPLNDSDWQRSDEDVRWKYGLPPKGNANCAWAQHFIHHLSPSGFAGFVLANGSMSSKINPLIPMSNKPKVTGANDHPLWRQISANWVSLNGNPHTVSLCQKTIRNNDNQSFVFEWPFIFRYSRTRIFLRVLSELM
jgi:hypothetical protein